MVAAPLGGFLTLDDGDSKIDITNIITAARWIGGIKDAVEDEIQRIELCAQFQPTLLISDKGRQSGTARLSPLAHATHLATGGNISPDLARFALGRWRRTALEQQG